MHQHITKFLLLFASLLSAVHAQDWLPVADTSLEVIEGSALDFSKFVEKGPAGQYGWSTSDKDGHIVFEKRQTPERFLAASIAFSPGNGGIPARDEAKQLVIQLKRTGYNAVRLHNIDATLMTGKDKDFDFDPDQFDNFQFLMSLLKEAGIYVILDVMNLDNGAFGGIYPHRWKIQHSLRRDLYLNVGARAHWLRLVKDLYGKRNKYTGISTLQDPAVLALILVNEGGLVELAFREVKGFDQPPPKVYEEPFRSWLKARYGSVKRLQEAWGNTAPIEDEFGSIKLPPTLRGNTPQHKDFMRFAADKEAELYNWMSTQVHELGFNGLTTAFNNWSFNESDISRSHTSAVDMHSYHVLPSAFVEPGSVVQQTSAISDSAKFVRELTSARQWGKPFIVSEYGQPFWNRYRRESVALVPAYAALQGWDLITQFAEAPLRMSYTPSAYQRGKAIYPWGVGADPILRAGERLSALLFKRGDVAPSAIKVNVQLNPEQTLNDNRGWGQLPQDVSRLALIGGLGLSVSAITPSASNPNSVVISNSGGGSGLLRFIKQVAVKVGLPISNAWVSTLRDQGLISKGNHSDFSTSVFESSTGQLLLSAKDRRFVATTPKTNLLILNDIRGTAGVLSVAKPSVPCLVAASSLDGLDLRHSRRILVFVLTDALNTGMTFSDKDRSTLKTLGTFPPTMEPIATHISLSVTNPDIFKIYALGFDGSRREQLPADAPSINEINFHIDTASLKKGPTPYFEVTSE